MAKYRRLRERLTAADVLPRGALAVPGPAPDRLLELAHDADWVRRATRGELTRHEVRRIGFPWSPALVERSRRSVGATVAAVDAALETGRGVNLAGGTHHAGTSEGMGYCVFNDAAVALRAALDRRAVRRAVVVDLDVHQGNGTADICGGDPRIFTLSVHAERNYPFHKVDGDLDVPLPDGTRDARYLDVLHRALRVVQDVARPDLCVFVAGADPWHGDRLGRLALTRQGLAARDAAVFAWADGLGIPVAVTMAGGYAPDVEHIVDLHERTVALALGRGASLDAVRPLVRERLPSPLPAPSSLRGS